MITAGERSFGISYFMVDGETNGYLDRSFDGGQIKPLFVTDVLHTEPKSLLPRPIKKNLPQKYVTFSG